MNTKFNELVARLETNQGANLVSVIVYGSAIAAPGNTKKADYQILILTKHMSAGDLRQIRPIAQWWADEGYSSPALFTEMELNSSLDTYPIEFGHMKRAYQVLSGRDPLAGKEISKAHLRWQTEHELRGKLLRLRALYLPASASTKDLTILMTDSIVSFVRFLRPVLELLGEDPPLGRLATVRRIGERLNIDTSPLVRVLQLRDEPSELMNMEVQDLFTSYHDCLTQVIETVDRM